MSNVRNIVKVLCLLALMLMNVVSVIADTNIYDNPLMERLRGSFEPKTYGSGKQLVRYREAYVGDSVSKRCLVIYLHGQNGIGTDNRSQDATAMKNAGANVKYWYRKDACHGETCHTSFTKECLDWLFAE